MCNNLASWTMQENCDLGGMGVSERWEETLQTSIRPSVIPVSAEILFLRNVVTSHGSTILSYENIHASLHTFPKHTLTSMHTYQYTHVSRHNTFWRLQYQITSPVVTKSHLQLICSVNINAFHAHIAFKILETPINNKVKKKIIEWNTFSFSLTGNSKTRG